MSQDIDQAIVQYMKHESMKGHFEHTRNEVKKGVTDFAGRAIDDALVRLQTREILGAREKGGRVKKTSLYYLTKIEDMCKELWGGESKVQD